MNRPLLLTGIGAGIVVVAITVNLVLLNEEAKETPLARQTEAQKQEPPGKAISEKSPKSPLKKPTEILSTIPPSFDVTRVNPKGDAVIAGRATPKSVVAILDGGKEIGTTTVDERGEWVFVPDKPLPPGRRMLSLEMRIKGAAPMPSRNQVLLVVPDKNKDIAGRETLEPSQALALRINKDTLGASTVLQRPSTGKGKDSYDLAIDTVDHDESGNIFIHGRGESSGLVQIYLDNELIGSAQVARDGTWILNPDTIVTPGDYTLRADQVDKIGKVQARVEFPFMRAAPPPEEDKPVTIVVKPGHSLWRIAQKIYGKGFRFTIIYDANKNRIRDPNMIYPGQVFTLPRTK